MHKGYYSTWLIAVGLVLSSLVVHAQQQLTPKEKREYALSLLEKYNLDGLKIIRSVDSLAFRHPFDQYAEGNTAFDVRNALGTMVHEMNHGYGALLAGKLKPKEANNYICYYLGHEQYRLVRYTPIFPTQEMGKTIPQNLRTFRFETYIFNPKEDIGLTSNKLGLYGLLDEWISYYHGSITDVNMYCWYEENTPGNAEDWYDYFSNVCSVINAHQEFKFFCLSYLIYAKKYYPQQYKALLQNQGMIDSFLNVNESFGQLLRNYHLIKGGIFANLRSKGIKITEDDEWIFLNRFGAGNFLAEYKILEKEMAKPAYLVMLQNLRNANKMALQR